MCGYCLYSDVPAMAVSIMNWKAGDIAIEGTDSIAIDFFKSGGSANQ